MYELLTHAAETILRDTLGVKDPVVTWERPQESAHGDIVTTVALRLAKELKQKPQDIAQALVDGFAKEESIEKAEVAGPGYVNLWLTPAVLLKELNSTREACTAKVVRKDEKPTIIDYCGPNIAKPLGIHHILATTIGQALINLYRHCGYNVVGWSYPGDWGTQFGKLSVAVEKWGDGRKASDYSIDELLALYVKFHDEAEKEPSLEEEARAIFAKLEEGDKELHAFWEDVVATSKKDLNQLYERLDVHIDVETGESFYEDKMQPILDEGEKKGVFVEGEKGALIVQFPEESGLPPYMVRKGDGSTLYSTRDLAMIRYRIDEYHPQAILYLVDVAQSLHFQQLFASCGQLKWDLPHLEHLVFGRMQFKDKKMSTRKGNILRLEEVLDEAVKRAEQVIKEHDDTIQTDDPEDLAEMMGVGAVVYGILSQNRKMDMTFDWDKVLSFDGNSAPYLQYTHARARSVLRKAEMEEGIVLPDQVDDLTEKERLLLGTLLQFERVLEEATRANLPHVLTNYLYQLCQDYNTFYNDEPILKAQEPQRSLRLALTHLTADVLKTGAAILTIRVPDRM